jgi:hypothetical protein
MPSRCAFKMCLGQLDRLHCAAMFEPENRSLEIVIAWKLFQMNSTTSCDSPCAACLCAVYFGSHGTQRRKSGA